VRMGVGGKWTWCESNSVEDDANGSGAEHARSSVLAFKAGRNMEFYVGTLKPKSWSAILLNALARQFERFVYLVVSCNEQLTASAKPPKRRGGWQAQARPDNKGG
jgi:hypothetical protein